MPKVKVPRKSTNIDMTAMCDVAFLLLTFFMLTTKFKADEPFTVLIPASVSEKKLPDTEIMTISIDKDKKVYFGIDGKFNREALLENISANTGQSFTPEEKKAFSLLSSFGVPLDSLKIMLGALVAGKKDYKQSGIPIPIDSTFKGKNELLYWVGYSFEVNPRFKIAIKGDSNIPYPVFKAVTNALQDPSIEKYQYYLVTSQKAVPAELRKGH